jgi:hypothetical protein
VVAVGLALALSVSAAACKDKDNAGSQPKPAQTTSAASPSASATSASPTPSSSPTPTAAKYDPLTGGKKSDNVVVAVKIDNVAAARPQVGINRADMVVVERVEGNLTRMMAIFHTEFPHRVGPVRSARNTDVRLLPMFGKPALVFSGANRKVLRQVRHSPYVRPVKRVNRDYRRVAPHNVIVHLNNVAKLPDIGKARPMGYTFGSGSQWKSAAEATSVKIDIGVDTFGFKYTDGRYQTRWNGQLNADGDTHKPVLTDNIVRLKVKSKPDTQTTSKKSNVAETIGSGEAIVYSQGKKVSGTWKRDKLNGPMTLKDAHGKNIPLKKGKTWILLDG